MERPLSLSYLRPALDVVAVFAPCWYLPLAWEFGVVETIWPASQRSPGWTSAKTVPGTLSQGDTLVTNSVPPLEDSRGIFKVILPVASAGNQVNPLRLRIKICVNWTWSQHSSSHPASYGLGYQCDRSTRLPTTNNLLWPGRTVPSSSATTTPTHAHNEEKGDWCRQGDYMCGLAFIGLPWLMFGCLLPNGLSCRWWGLSQSL